MTRESSIGSTAGAREESTRLERRRQFLVDPKYQIRAGITVGVVAFLLLALLNLSLWTSGRQTGTGTAPVRGAFAADGASWLVVLAGSAVFLAGVILIGVFESHRTAGAAFAIRRTVDEIRSGRQGARVRLRRGDHLRELAAAVNALAEAVDAERAAHR